MVPKLQGKGLGGRLLDRGIRLDSKSYHVPCLTILLVITTLTTTTITITTTILLVSLPLVLLEPLVPNIVIRVPDIRSEFYH